MTAIVVATVVGALCAIGTYLLLQQDLVRVVWGLSLLGQAANVYLLAMGNILPASPDAVPVLAGHGEPPSGVTDPLVQALVLTAIVIGFGMTAFALFLSYRVYQEHGTLALAELAEADEAGDRR
ncbi:sodium:proton antiporter [Natronosalvus caseinilyticus]|uniref:sodium:proton antiporter n=1 Tax=Natronosalvus caseinilyticus TaxID=2953747 RepID=UPI0028AA1739|nr:sodium:proton antiporter [Natronosalvus caseinilyticus]